MGWCLEKHRVHRGPTWPGARGSPPTSAVVGGSKVESVNLGKCQALLESGLAGGSDQTAGQEGHRATERSHTQSWHRFRCLCAFLQPGATGKPTGQGAAGAASPTASDPLRSPRVLCTVSSGSQGPWPSCPELQWCRVLPAMASTPASSPAELSPALPIPQAFARTALWLGPPGWGLPCPGHPLSTRCGPGQCQALGWPCPAPKDHRDRWGDKDVS